MVFGFAREAPGFGVMPDCKQFAGGVGVKTLGIEFGIL